MSFVSMPPRTSLCVYSKCSIISVDGQITQAVYKFKFLLLLYIKAQLPKKKLKKSELRSFIASNIHITLNLFSLRERTLIFS